MNPGQRQVALYTAEESALGGLGRCFADIGQVRAYVAELIAGDWWGDRWPQVDRIEVGRTRSRQWHGYALEGGTEIRLASLSEPVVLHEIAHVVTPGAAHGPGFLVALLALVRRQMGFHAYGTLLAELGRHGLVPTTGGS